MSNVTDIKVGVIAGIAGLVVAFFVIAQLGEPWADRSSQFLDPGGTGSEAFASPEVADEVALATAPGRARDEPASAAPRSATTRAPATPSAAADGASPSDARASGPRAERSERATPAPAQPARSASSSTIPAAYTTVRVTSDMPIMAEPGSGTRIGTLGATSRYLAEQTTAWVTRTTPDGAWGQVWVPWEQGRRRGWVDLRGSATTEADVVVHISLSRRELSLVRGGSTEWTVPAGIGGAASPTPPGRYWVTDMVATGNPTGPFGHYAFGISGLQDRLPPGWTGGDQLAVHGTNEPHTIGHAASAGCVRLTAEALDRMREDVQLGTPVIIER